MARLALISLLALLACGKKDNGGDGDTSETAAPRDCTEPAAGILMESGQWEFSIDEQLANSCENIHGKGIHVHVGDTTQVDLTRDGSCVDGQDADGDGVPIDPGLSGEGMIYTQWEGSTDGSTVELSGWIEVPVGGTCFLAISPTLRAELTAANEMTYQMDADIAISQEGTCGNSKLQYENGRWSCVSGEWTSLADACDITMGDAEYHTLPAVMPCFQSWTGSATLKD